MNVFTQRNEYSQLPTEEYTIKRTIEWEHYLMNLFIDIPIENIGYDHFNTIITEKLLSKFPNISAIELNHNSLEGTLQISRLNNFPKNIRKSQLFFPDSVVQSFMVAKSCVNLIKVFENSKNDLNTYIEILEIIVNYILNFADIEIIDENFEIKKLNIEILKNIIYNNIKINFVETKNNTEDIMFGNDLYCCLGTDHKHFKDTYSIKDLYNEFMDNYPHNISTNVIHKLTSQIRYHYGLPSVPVWWFSEKNNKYFIESSRFYLLQRNDDNINIYKKNIKFNRNFNGITAEDVLKFVLNTPALEPHYIYNTSTNSLKTLDWLKYYNFIIEKSRWDWVDDHCIFDDLNSSTDIKNKLHYIRQIILYQYNTIVLIDINWRKTEKIFDKLCRYFV
jgi:hypothetical protein